jgi:class 3 adenylate cyclase
MLNYLKKIGIDEKDSPEIRIRKFTLLIITLSCCVAAPIWSWSYYLMGLRISSLIPIAYVLIILPCISVFAINKNEKLLMNAQLIFIFLCPVIMQWLAGGFVKGGVIILWAFLSPLSALIFHDLRKARLCMALVIIAIICTWLFDDYFEKFGYYLDKSQQILLNTMNLAGATLVIFFAMQYFVKTINKNARLLEAEKKKSDTLLLNILPAQVAEELKENGKSNPTLYSDTTIIFTDFKDFTQFSELFTPEELIKELDNCFEKFDEIITANNLEKIKTIGDAYLCVAGIPKNEDDAVANAVRAVKASVEIAGYISDLRNKKLKEGKTYWDIRIGVHTGDVVAGIVGKKKFAFDIWGDAVNMASRIESEGETGKVNISGSTYELVKDKFDCVYRGKIQAKNKGLIDMYFVSRSLSEG